MNTIDLYKEQFSMTHEISDLAQKLAYEEISTEKLVDGLRYRLVGHIFAQNAFENPVRVGRYPANWWEALKERWFPKFMLKRWPVLYAYIWVTGKILYPYLRVALPKETKVLKIMVSPYHGE